MRLASGRRRMRHGRSLTVSEDGDGDACERSIEHFRHASTPPGLLPGAGHRHHERGLGSHFEKAGKTGLRGCACSNVVVSTLAAVVLAEG